MNTYLEGDSEFVQIVHNFGNVDCATAEWYALLESFSAPTIVFDIPQTVYKLAMYVA